MLPDSKQDYPKTSEAKQQVKAEEQIDKLNKIGIALSSEQNLNKLLEVIVAEARSFTHADGGSIYIIEDGRLNFVVAQTESLQRRGGNKEPFKSVYLPLTTESIAGYVATTGELLNLADVYRVRPTVEYRVNKRFDIQNNYRSKSMLVVPMKDAEGNTTGVLQLINSTDANGKVVPFCPEHESLILSLASQAAVAIQNVRLIEEIKNLFKSLVRYSVKAIDARSPHTAGHSGRVAMYAVRIADAINRETSGRFADVGFTPPEIEELRMAGWLHDIGKIGVSERVLEKEAKLTDDQLNCIRERFESIKRAMENEFLESQIECLLENNKRLGHIERYRQASRSRTSEVDRDFEFLKRINVPGYLTKKDRARLKSIAEKTYRSIKGETCYFLLPEEYEHLAVVKGNLTKAEYVEVQGHVAHTLDILEKIPFTRDLANIPAHAAGHHEYLDGSGYPRGLHGDEISIQSRILCVADIYDALSSPDRPYKQPMSTTEALVVLDKEVAAGKIDSDIVRVFIENKLYQATRCEDDD